MSFVFTWLVMALVWICLSGFFDPIHLGFGAVSVTIVSALSHSHLTQGGAIGQGLARMARVAVYFPWLLWQIVLANVEVVACVMGWKPISPSMFEIKPQLASSFGVAVLANSITLTPGTVTVDVRDGGFLIHALTAGAATGTGGGAMEARVRRIEGGPTERAASA